MRKVKEMQIEDTYHTKAQRLQALGDIRGVQDLVLRKIQEQAETLFLPKAYRAWGDWLQSQRETP
jgi:hypothetical protein